jgi:hypothetical protein
MGLTFVRVQNMSECETSVEMNKRKTAKLREWKSSRLVVGRSSRWLKKIKSKGGEELSSRETLRGHF